MADTGFMQAQLAHKKRLRAKSDRGLKIFLLVCVLVYTFFFTSKYFFPKVYSKAEITQIGSVIDIGNYKFTLDAWDYAEKDHTFEVLLETEDLSLERDSEYSFVFRAGDEVYRNELYRTVGNMLVVRAYRIPSRWTNISLTITAGGEKAVINMDDRTTPHVGRLADRTDTEYSIHALESKVSGYEATLATLEKDAAAKTDDIEYSHEKLEELVANKKTQTSAEQKDTDQSIEKISATQAKLQNELEDIMLEEQALKEKIDMQNKLLDELRK